MTPAQLEPYFQKWEGVWKNRERDLNNPKIPVKFVQQQGTLVYPLSTEIAPTKLK